MPVKISTVQGGGQRVANTAADANQHIVQFAPSAWLHELAVVSWCLVCVDRSIVSPMSGLHVPWLVVAWLLAFYMFD